MASRKKNYHVGGEQLPLIVPESSWVPPTSLPDLRRCKLVALDRETKDDGLSGGKGPGWAFGSGHVCGTAIAWREGAEYRSLYAPVRHRDTTCVDADAWARWEKDHQKAGVTFVMQNAPYDIGWGHRDLGVPVPERIHDVLAAANIADQSWREYNLGAICERLGLPGKDETLLREAMIAYGYHDVKQNMWRLPARFVGPYAEIDAVRTLQCHELLEPMLDEDDLRKAYQLEIDLIPMVHEMRRRGVRVDTDAAERAQEVLRKAHREACDDLGRRLKRTVSIEELRKNEWLDATFTEHKVPFPRDQKDRGSFDSKWMKNVDHWLPQLVVKAKSTHDASEKFIGTYILGFSHFDGTDSRLHATINQFMTDDGGTRTYRFSYSDPPLQQMPHRDEFVSMLIRGIFLPERGEVWLGADYSQQEYRLIVHYAEVMGLDKAREAAERYRSDPTTDFHSMVAEMTGLERKPAKDTNFAKSYGAGIGKFAAMIGKSEAEAEKIMKQYDEQMPFNKQLYERCQAKAERTGFIRLLDGARIRFEQWEAAYLSREERGRGWNSGGTYQMGVCSLAEAKERQRQDGHPWAGKRLRRADCRKASNALIQGGAARQTKLGMIACWRAGHVPLLQMHDELDFSIRSAAAVAEITNLMLHVVKLRVPMQVDAECGVNWGAARVVKDKNKKVVYDASFASAMKLVRAAGKGKRVDKHSH